MYQALWDSYLPKQYSHNGDMGKLGYYTTFLDAAFAASIPVLVAVSINFCTIFITKVSSKRQNTITFNTFSKSWLS